MNEHECDPAVSFPGSWILRETPSAYGSRNAPARIRVAVFGSFMGGFHVLKELLEGPLAERTEVVGVATDDPTQVFTHPKVRLWKYPHSGTTKLSFLDMRANLGFQSTMAGSELRDLSKCSRATGARSCALWRPSAKIPNSLIRFPASGFYNFHHSGDLWPSYPRSRPDSRHDPRRSHSPCPDCPIPSRMSLTAELSSRARIECHWCPTPTRSACTGSPGPKWEASSGKRLGIFWNMAIPALAEAA